MAVIGFIGLGNMGLPMARNLIRAGHRLRAFDLAPASLEAAVTAGAAPARSAADAAAGAELVITMLPEGRHVRAVYLGPDGVIAASDPQALLIDCSTIDVATARAVDQAAGERGLEVIDAPVSGGVAGAENASLTFMVGGSEAGFGRAQPILRQMGKAVIHTGPSGNGQAAKICNNMLLGISMIGVAEAFVLAERLGLSAAKLFEVSSQSSGQCWSLTNYCPVPGLVAELTGQPGLPGGVHRGDDGQGPASGPGCGAERRRADPARRHRAPALRAVRQQRARQFGLFRDHQDGRR